MFAIACVVGGNADSARDSYTLPYAKDASQKLLQGYGGPYGHKGHSVFAYDFQMPIGIEVLAARGGDSGASAGPHLHFDVTKECFDWGCQTIKVEFENVKENPLKAGLTADFICEKRQQTR